MKRFLHVAVAVLAICMLALTAACNTLETFKAPDLPAAELATLDGHHRFYFLYEERVGISSVDGSRAGGLVLGAGSVRLPPGRHWIEIQEFVGLPWAAGFKSRQDIITN